MANIHVDEEALNFLKNALQTAGEDYRDKLSRLTGLVSQITSGTIKGDPATDLLEKFEAKRDFFNRVLRTIEEAEELSKTENVEYFGVADILDVLCKNAYANGVITKEQWYTVINRYPI